MPKTFQALIFNFDSLHTLAHTPTPNITSHPSLLVYLHCVTRVTPSPGRSWKSMCVWPVKEPVGSHTHLPATWKSWKLVLLHILFPSLSHFQFFKNNHESHICFSHFLNPVKAPILMLVFYIMKIHLNTHALHPCEASRR